MDNITISDLSVKQTLEDSDKFVIRDENNVDQAIAGSALSTKFQAKGDYVTPTSLETTLEDYETSAHAENTYQPKGNYANPYSIEQVIGGIFNASGDNVAGLGQAVVTLQNGKAKIEFEVYITGAGSSSSVFNLGINRDILHALNSNVPTITPGTGTCTFMNNDGTINVTMEGYGGVVRANGQFWQLGRIHNQSGDTGGWPASMYTAGMRIKGTCYGTYS